MKYKNPRDSQKLSEVLSIIFDNSLEVNKIADELDQSRSTASRKLKALQQEDLVRKNGYEYEVNKDHLFEEFWQKIGKDIRFGDVEKRKQFDRLKDEMRNNKYFRDHLLSVIENELDLSHTPLNAIFTKYRDDLKIRYDLVYQLTKNDLTNGNLSEEKREFWKYLQIIQAYLPHAAWTEPIHGTALQSLIYPGEEHKMEDVDDMWHQLVETANENLENMNMEV